MSDSFLGCGWGFPVAFESAAQGVEMVSDELDIEQSLHLLLATRPGERVMQPDFGCGLHALVFEVIDARTLGRIHEVIERAILFYEPRIRLERVDLDPTRAPDGILDIRIHYSIRSTNTRSNIVYPFYLREGTHVRL